MRRRLNPQVFLVFGALKVKLINYKNFAGGLEDIAIGAGGLPQSSVCGPVNQTERCQRLAIAARLLQSCEVQALRRGDGPCHPLHPPA